MVADTAIAKAAMATVVLLRLATIPLSPIFPVLPNIFWTNGCNKATPQITTAGVSRANEMIINKIPK